MNKLIAKHAKIATILAVVFGATSGILGTLTQAPSMAIGFWRLTMALPFFAVPILIKKEDNRWSYYTNQGYTIMKTMRKSVKQSRLYWQLL